jgi:hypothetical protein
MPLLDIQRRAAQLGRIRIGQQVATGRVDKNGNPILRPSRLETFRLTTPSRATADEVARLLGGTVHPFEHARTAGQWEVVTDLSSLPVMVPPVGALSQDYELWTAAGCVRRCDSVTDRVSGQPCLCPSDPQRRQEMAQNGGACKAVTRLNVMLPDLPGLGLWRIDTHSYYAAVELGGVAPLLEEAAAQGVSVPAELAIEQREVRRPGQKPKHFPVPVLRVLTTLRQMAAIGQGQRPTLAAQLPPPVQPLAALTSGQERQQQTERQPAGAQVFLARALQCDDTGSLKVIWGEAFKAGVIDDFVDVPGSEAMEMLSEVLQQRAADLEQEAGA